MRLLARQRAAGSRRQVGRVSMIRQRRGLERIEQWDWLIAAAGAALFALRVSLECMPQRVPWGVAVALGWLFAGALLRSTSFSFAPLWLAWLYVLWPAASPALALSVAFVSLAALAVANGRRVPPAVVDGLVFAAALALYLATLAPTLLPADSGEFQIVGPVLGVAHPPGYAMFTVLAKLFSLLPWGEVAWRVNLMGAVTGALTLVVVGRTARRLTRSTWAGLAASAALAVSTTFWAQSTTINIRALIVFLTALCLDQVVAYLAAPAGSRAGARALAGLAVAFGLLVAHHYPQAAFAPLFAVLVFWHDPQLLKRFRTWPRTLAALLLPFLVNLYIVVRAITGAPFGTDALTSPARVVDHLLGRGFSGDMFAFLQFNRILWERFLVVGNILHFQFGALLLVASAAGLAWLVRRQRKQAVLFGGVFAVMAFIVATYRAPQSVEYLMPAYVPVALGAGCAVGLVAGISRSRLARALLVALLFLPAFALGRTHLPSYLALHGDRSARAYAQAVLLHAPAGAHILSNWHWYTPLRYLQLVEGQRPDVEVTYVFPQGATAMPQAWPERIERELAHSDRPLIVTNYYPTYRDLPCRFEPHGEAFLVRAGPSDQTPTGLIRTDADLSAGTDQVRILGYRLHHGADVRPGDWVTVDLAWQPRVRLGRGYAFFVQLVGDSGVPLGQRDRRHDVAPTYAPGEVLVDRYRFPVFLTAAPGTYRLIAGVYDSRADGSWERMVSSAGTDAVVLSTLVLQPATTPPVTLHPQHRAFQAGPTLVGVDYDDTVLEQRRVYLHWRAGTQGTVAQVYQGDQLVAEGTVPPVHDPGYVTTALDLPPGATDLRLSLRQPDTGTAIARRGLWGIGTKAPVPLPQPDPRQHYVPFGGKLALIGVNAQDEWAAGQTQRVALSFLGLRPIVRDYVISVSVLGSRLTDGPSDNVPAIGAIPTFKWVRGSRVTDVHLLPVRADASGQAQLMVNVYDASTAEALPPLDERIARLGLAGVPVQQISIP